MLPWYLCGLASPKESDARRVAAESIRMLDSVTEPLAHHRITLRFLQDCTILRQQLNAFLAGTPLRELPDLEMEVGKLSLVRIVERIIEARASSVRHAIVRRSHGRSQSILDVAVA